MHAPTKQPTPHDVIAETAMSFNPEPLRRLARRVLPHRFLRGSSLVNDPDAQRLLRRIESCGYRVRVWRAQGDQPGTSASLHMSAENTWAHHKHTALAPIGHGDEEVSCAAQLSEKVAFELEG